MYPDLKTCVESHNSLSHCLSFWSFHQQDRSFSTSFMCFFLHHRTSGLERACVCVDGKGVSACLRVQMSVSDVICHADRQPAVGLITAGQPNAWPASGRGPRGGSGGSIIHLHPCLCIMAAPCDRWPVYLWSPAATEPDSHTHTLL